MDGMTNADFISSHIELWDYKGWAMGVKDMLEGEIEILRDKINLAFNDLQKEQYQLLIGSNDGETPVTIPSDLFPRIGKYDNSKLMINYFEYLLSRNKFLSEYVKRERVILDSVSSTDKLKHVALYYYNLVNLKRLHKYQMRINSFSF